MTAKRTALLASTALVALSIMTPAQAQTGWATLTFGNLSEEVTFEGDGGSSFDVTNNIRDLSGEAGFNIPMLQGYSVSFGVRRAVGQQSDLSEIDSFAEYVLPLAGAYFYYEGIYFGALYGFYPDELDVYESKLETVDLEIGREIGIGSGSRVTFGLRSGKLSHMMRISGYSDGSFYDGYYYDGDCYYSLCTLEAAASFEGHGVRIGAELNFPVAPQLTVMTEFGASYLKATGHQTIRLTEDGFTVANTAFDFAEDTHMSMIDASVALAYAVSPNIKAFGGYRMDRVTVQEGLCGDCGDMVFDFQGVFAGIRAEF